MRSQSPDLFFYLARHGRVFILISHLDQEIDVIIGSIQILDGLHQFFEMLQFLHQFLGFFRIIPEARLLYFALQFFNPSYLAR